MTPKSLPPTPTTVMQTGPCSPPLWEANPPGCRSRARPRAFCPTTAATVNGPSTSSSLPTTRCLQARRRSFKSSERTETPAPSSVKRTFGSSLANREAQVFRSPTPCSQTLNPGATNPPRSPSPTKATAKTTFVWPLPSLHPAGPSSLTHRRFL